MDKSLDVRRLIQLYITKKLTSVEIGLIEVIRFIHQITKGCGNADCTASTCYSRRLATIDKPLRRYTELSARAAAFHLATLDSPWTQMCPTVVAQIYSWEPNQWSGTLPNGDIEKRSTDMSQSKKDTKSYSQQVFDTRIIKSYLSSPMSAEVSSTEKWYKLEIALGMAQKYTLSDPEWAPLGVSAILTCINGIVSLLPKSPRHRNVDKATLQYKEAFEDKTVFTFSRKLIAVVSELTIKSNHACKDSSCNSAKINPGTATAMCDMLVNQLLHRAEQFSRSSSGKGPISEVMPKRYFDFGTGFHTSEIYALLQCALGVLSEVWDGDSNLDYHSNAGEALRVLDLLHHVLRWTWPELPFRKLFGDTFQEKRLQPMECAKQFAQKSSSTISILTCPFLFSHQAQVESFRAICFHRMERAVEEAHLNLRLLVSGMTWHSHDPPEVRQLVSGPLRTATARCFALQVCRENLLDDLLDQLWRRERRELLRPLRVEITNEGEEGLDQGGVAQELFQAAFTTILDPSYGMFIVDPLTKMTWFNPAAIEPLHKFELLGVLFALAIHNGFILPVTFPRVFYEKLINPYPPLARPFLIADGWPTLYKNLIDMLEWSDGDVEDIFVRQYAFSIEAYGEVVHVDMTKSYSDEWTLDAAMIESATNSLEAPLVNNETRSAFAKDYVDWLINKSIHAQFEAFARGFHSLIPRSLLATVTSAALQTLAEGYQEINMTDLEAATTYDGGYSFSSPAIRNFWAVVGAYDDEHKRDLLEFITASDRLPVSGARGVRLLIQKNGGDGERLPTAMTCFATLLLPEYKDREKLRAKLEVVLGEARGFGLR